MKTIIGGHGLSVGYKHDLVKIETIGGFIEMQIKNVTPCSFSIVPIMPPPSNDWVVILFQEMIFGVLGWWICRKK